jgi:inosine-uridine nucleoside N-ribohydrolase
MKRRIILDTDMGSDVDDALCLALALHRTLARAVRHWTPVMTAFLTGSGADPGIDNAAVLHDPLALACAYDESFCAFEELWIEPRTEDGVLRTFERSAAAPGRGVRRVRCATAVDSGRFVAHVRSRLGLPP